MNVYGRGKKMGHNDRKWDRLPPFVAVRKDMLRDPEWRKLSFSAMVLYLYMRAKFNTKTLGTVSLPYSEMKDMMSSKTVSKAFKTLEEKGWIKKTKQGGMYGGACIYEFSGPYRHFWYKKGRV